MRSMARMLAVCVAICLTVVAAYAASFTLNNGTQESFSVLLNYTDSSSESVWMNASSTHGMEVGTKVVSSVTINGQTVASGYSNYPVTLTNNVRIYVSVSSNQVVTLTIPAD